MQGSSFEHSSFEVGPIFDNCPLQIESLARWGQKLLVGTSEGLLLIMGGKDPPAAARPAGRARPPQYQIEDTKRSFSKNHKPIIQLDVLGAEGQRQILVSLSDTITLHELPSFNPIGAALAKTKGCNLYCLSGTKGSSAAPVLLCATVKKRVLIYSWEGQQLMEMKDLAVPDTIRSAVFCGTDHLCFGTKREYFLVNTATGQPTNLFAVSHSRDGNPVTVVLPSKEILVVQDRNGIFIGFDGKPSRKYAISWPEPPLTLALSYPYVLAASATSVDIRCISQSLRKLCSQKQDLRGVHSLLAQPDAAGYGGKVFVASSATPEQGGKSQVHLFQPVPLMSQVDELMGSGNFSEALALCEEIESLPVGSMPCPERELRSKMKSIYKTDGVKLFEQGDFTGAIERFQDAVLHPDEVVAMFPELVGDAADTPKRIAADRYEAIMAVSDYLETARVNLQDPLVVQELYGATMTSSASVAVNSALLKCYVLTKHSSKLSEHVALPAARCPCDVEDCAKFLLYHGKESEAVQLYNSHLRHRDALQLLQKVGTEEGSEGVIDTVAYLQRLGGEDADLVCEFSKWVLKVDAQSGLSIFTSRAATGDQSIDQTRVLVHLKSVCPDCVPAYLEYAVESDGNTSRNMHTELVQQYLQQVKQLASASGRNSAESKDVREKLTAFLKKSKYYNAEELLADPSFSVEDMPENRAFLLGRTGNHVQALHIYVHRLGDEHQAEEYCKDTFDPTDDLCSDVYLALLKVYLTPEQPYAPQIDAAMRVLATYAKYMDTSKVLDLLPPQTPIAQLQDFLRSSIRVIIHKKRTQQVVKNIMKGENLSCTKALGEAHYEAGTRYKRGEDWQNALQNFEKAAATFGKVYGESHLVTKETKGHALFCMGGVYENQRDLHSAANYYEQAAELFTDTVGEEHPFTVAAREKESACL